jgi:large subunit ribosomal protein L17
MAKYGKLNKPSDQRKAMMRNLVTSLIWTGRIETTGARAKQAQKVAEKYITLAVRECGNEVEVTKTIKDKDGEKQITFTNDSPTKLAARRKMLSYLYNVKEVKQDKESKYDYRMRTKDNKFPVIEKLFKELGPKYKARKEETGTGGGYTRIIKLGPRRGDAAQMVILELV